MFALMIAAFATLAGPAHRHDRPASLHGGVAWSESRERYAQSWHYLPGEGPERRLDHLENLWDRNGMRRYARVHGGAR